MKKCTNTPLEPDKIIKKFKNLKNSIFRQLLLFFLFGNSVLYWKFGYTLRK